MLSLLYILFIIITAGAPLWLTVLIIAIASKNKNNSSASTKDDDFETASTIAVLCD